jgi:hypothetical protein
LELPFPGDDASRISRLLVRLNRIGN